MTERVVSINPERRNEYLGAVEKRFREWHEDWVLVYPSFDFFRENIADASFLACLEYSLEAVGDTGQVEAFQLEGVLRERLGKYFSQRKFENVVDFLETGDWNEL